jgi:hypothetical protein
MCLFRADFYTRFEEFLKQFLWNSNIVRACFVLENNVICGTSHKMTSKFYRIFTRMKNTETFLIAPSNIETYF